MHCFSPPSPFNYQRMETQLILELRLSAFIKIYPSLSGYAFFFFFFCPSNVSNYLLGCLSAVNRLSVRSGVSAVFITTGCSWHNVAQPGSWLSEGERKIKILQQDWRGRYYRVITDVIQPDNIFETQGVPMSMVKLNCFKQLFQVLNVA